MIAGHRSTAVIATSLNFLLPGAGLWYLGRPGLGAINFLAATGLVAGVWVRSGGFVEDHLHWVALVAAAASAGLAHSLAVQKGPDRDQVST
jgi:hypothetical protein